MSEIKEIIEGALNTHTFNLIDFVKGRALAEDDVELFTNEDAALHLKDVVEGVDVEAEGFIPTEEMKELMEAFRASKITLHLKAMDPKEFEPLRDKVHKETSAVQGKLGKNSDEEKAIWNQYRNTLLSNMLVKTTNSEGAEDTEAKTIEDIDTFRTYLPESQREVLEDAVVKVVFASSAIDLSADPDFLVKF